MPSETMIKNLLMLDVNSIAISLGSQFFVLDCTESQIALVKIYHPKNRFKIFLILSEFDNETN